MTEAEEKIKVAIATLGCKVNQYESASFQSGLLERGAEIVPFSHRADVYVINTCAVTAKAGAQSRQMVRRALKTNRRARLVVTGCYAQVASQKIMEIGDFPICIVGNGYKHMLVDIVLAEKHCDLEMHMGDIGARKEICHLPVSRFPGRTRTYLKLQDGCNNFCSYCIVPFARGRSRSLPPEAAFDQIQVFAGQGYREIVLTGIHVGMYGLDLSPATGLLTFLDQASGRFPDMRFRLSSLEPMEVHDDLLSLIRDRANLMPHLHIPLQSGDDTILKEMNRHYRAGDFEKIVYKVKEYLPDAAIGVDVLVGFPGEDEKAFARTLSLMERLPVSYLHVFPFSKRPGTIAATIKKQVPGHDKKARVALLRELSLRKKRVFYQQYLGTNQQVLAENSSNRFRLMRGFTENYIPVLFPAPDSMTNQVLTVRLDRLEEDLVFGQRQ